MMTHSYLRAEESYNEESILKPIPFYAVAEDGHSIMNEKPFT